MQERIGEMVEENRRVVARFFQDSLSDIIEFVDLATACLRDGRKVLVFGNGGSAADASHLAAELVNRFRRDRAPLPAVALTTDPSVLTSIANDFGYDEVFSRQVLALGTPGDVAVGISTSGKSPNVVRGLDAAASRGMKTVVLTGETGGALAERADVGLVVPATATPRIQEVHALLLHVLCELVEESLFPDA